MHIITKKTPVYNLKGSATRPEGWWPFPEGKLSARIDKILPGTRNIRRCYWNPRKKQVLVLWHPDSAVPF